MKPISFLYGIAVIYVTIMLCGWATHVIWTISIISSSEEMLTNENMLAIIEAIAVPLGAIHGLTLWF